LDDLAKTLNTGGKAQIINGKNIVHTASPLLPEVDF
jgi:hypothetical protein